MGLRRGGLALALAALLALPPGTALARPSRLGVHMYHVIYEGSGSYQVGMSGPGGVSGKTEAGFHWKVAYSPLLIAPRQGWGIAMTTLKRGSSGAGEWSLSSRNGEESCAKAGGLKLTPRGTGTGAVEADGSLSLELTPGRADFTTSGGNSGPGPCDTADFWHDWVTSFSHVGIDEGHDPLVGFVKLSRRDLRASKVIVNVSNRTLAAPDLAPARDCGAGHGTSCVQEFSWRGRVTVTRARSARRDRGPVAAPQTEEAR